MAALSLSPPERGRKIVTTIMGRVKLAESQGAIATAIGKSEATVTRLLGDHLDNFGAVLAQLGLKVVPDEYRCVDPETYAFLTSTHERVMRKAPELIWDREE